MVTVDNLSKFIVGSKEIDILVSRIKMLYVENYELLSKIVSPQIIAHSVNDDYFTHHMGETITLYHKFKGEVLCRIETSCSYLNFRKISKKGNPKHSKYDPEYMYFDKGLTDKIGRKEYKKVPVYEGLPLPIIAENKRLESERSIILSDIDKYSNELRCLINKYANDLYLVFDNGSTEAMVIRHIRISNSKLEIEISSAKSIFKTERLLSFKF